MTSIPTTTLNSSLASSQHSRPTPGINPTVNRLPILQLFQDRPDAHCEVTLVAPSWLDVNDEGPALSIQVDIFDRPNNTQPDWRGLDDGRRRIWDEEATATVANAIQNDLTTLLRNYVAASYKRWEVPGQALVGGCCSNRLKDLKSHITLIVSHYSKNLPDLPSGVLDDLEGEPPTWISCRLGDKKTTYTFSAYPDPTTALAVKRSEASGYPCEFPCCVAKSVLTDSRSRVPVARYLQEGRMRLHLKPELSKNLFNPMSEWIGRIPTPNSTASLEAQSEILHSVADLFLNTLKEERMKKPVLVKMFSLEQLDDIVTKFSKTDRGGSKDIFGTLEVTVERPVRVSSLSMLTRRPRTDSRRS